ncbi:MAG: hypothetical protein IPJ88_11330 [Myxococcales bacterium]|nr:MAG: hypothetical protein IPJ88_11330 [Myxococcales bacterium]
MAFLGLFKENKDKTLRKHAERIANKRAQSPDRWESIKVLSAMNTPEAISAMLGRFTFVSDPSITDQEEKDAVFESVVSAKEMAV